MSLQNQNDILEISDAIISYNNKICDGCKLREICDDNELFCLKYIQTSLEKRSKQNKRDIEKRYSK